MKMMIDKHWLSVSAGMLALFAGACAAQQAAPPPASSQPATAAEGEPLPEHSTNDLLDRMHLVGEKLTSLRADIDMETVDDLTGNASARTGRFALQRNADGDSRARVTLDQLVVEEGDRTKIIPEKVEYLLEGDWVIDRVYGRGPNDPGGRRETHRQIRKPGEKVDLLKLGEGPFPLPIGQPRDSVRAQFEVTRLPDDPQMPGLVGLELMPREETRLARRFHQIIVWVNHDDAMPRIIETVSASVEIDPQTGKPQAVPGTESKRTTLSNVKINEPMTDADFRLDAIDESTWTIVTQEYEE